MHMCLTSYTDQLKKYCTHTNSSSTNNFILLLSLADQDESLLQKNIHTHIYKYIHAQSGFPSTWP